VLLDNKNAVIYGGAGAVGRAVAKAFAREGAAVHLAGRTRRRLDAVANEIRFDGGQATTAMVDALDEAQVDAYVDGVATSAGGIDISFNLVSQPLPSSVPLAEMPLDLFEQPIHAAVRTQFLTARAAARHMIKQRSGVILFFGGAVETLRRRLAVELGEHGIRVVTLHTGGIAETGRVATIEDLANVAAFVASEKAVCITAAALDITCGTASD
jgi:3-oxoacyl-[acyl-carrier protein] reductase